MVSATFGATPFPLALIDSSDLIEEVEIFRLMPEGSAISLLIRESEGPESRGGYYFHLSNNGNTIKLHDFEGVYITSITRDDVAAFVNHVSGRQFHAESFAMCQDLINFKGD